MNYVKPTRKRLDGAVRRPSLPSPSVPRRACTPLSFLAVATASGPVFGRLDKVVKRSFGRSVRCETSSLARATASSTRDRSPK